MLIRCILGEKSKISLSNIVVLARSLSTAPSTLKIPTRTKHEITELMKKYQSKILFNSILEKNRPRYKKTKIIAEKFRRRSHDFMQKLDSIEPIPLSLKYLNAEKPTLEETDEITEDEESEKASNFPFEQTTIVSESEEKSDESEETDPATLADEEVRKRYEMKNWMTAYDNYNDKIETNLDEDWKINYGTPAPNVPTSIVPCGGCGALLHCKEPSIPGYIPSEIFKNSRQAGGVNLEAIVCQRCHFLKSYNLALQMQVASEDYPKILQTISERNAIVVLMVDLLDFPCSIWPGIADIFRNRVPIVVVGNKVDLLPQDDNKFFERIKNQLLESVKLSGFATKNIKFVGLISAKTGFGVEDLITVLQGLYRIKGDFYLVGCTNVGKSTLFNILLQSDFCKVQAVDLVQRATTSVWPGTTLNLLKFPIKRPAGLRQHLRHQRLIELGKITKYEAEERRLLLKKTQDPKYATLMGRIEMTKMPKEVDAKDEIKDMFHVQGARNASGRLKMGLDESRYEFVASKWCYDTPGVVQPDQIIHLLTTDELMKTLPKDLIVPETFCIHPGQTLFIGGLARLDYLEGLDFIRITVFRSNEIPLTVCHTEDADEIYNTFLGTEYYGVPEKGERLNHWKGLEASRELTVTGVGIRHSCNDIVLSNAGWVAITGEMGEKYKFQGWTPERRGVHLRESLLPKAVSRRGSRIRNTITYKRHRFYLK